MSHSKVLKQRVKHQEPYLRDYAKKFFAENKRKRCFDIISDGRTRRYFRDGHIEAFYS